MWLLHSELHGTKPEAAPTSWLFKIKTHLIKTQSGVNICSNEKQLDLKVKTESNAKQFEIVSTNKLIGQKPLHCAKVLGRL